MSDNSQQQAAAAPDGSKGKAKATKPNQSDAKAKRAKKTQTAPTEGAGDDVDEDDNTAKSNQPASKRHVKLVSDALMKTMCIPVDPDNDIGGRSLKYQVRASQAPARTILDVQFVDEKGRSNHSGFDLKHKGAFGVAQIKPGEKKRLEQANVDTGESAADLSSKYTGRWVDEAVEVVVAKPSPGDTPSVPYMLLVEQLQNNTKTLMQACATLMALVTQAGMQLPAEFEGKLQVVIAEMPHLQLSEGIYEKQLLGYDAKGKPKYRHFNNAVEKSVYDQCLGPREREMAQQEEMRRVRAEQQARWTRQMIESARPAVINEVIRDDDDGLGLHSMVQDNDDFRGGEDELAGVFGGEPVSVVVRNQQKAPVNVATQVVVELKASSPVPPVHPVITPGIFASNGEADREVSHFTPEKITSEEFMKRYVVVDNPDPEELRKREKQRKAEIADDRKREREETKKQKEEERLQKQQEKDKAKKAKTEVRTVTAIPPEQRQQQQQQFIPPSDLPLGVREGSRYNPVTVPDSPRNDNDNNNNSGPFAVNSSSQPKLHDFPVNDLLQTDFMAAANFPPNMIEAVLNTDLNALRQPQPIVSQESVGASTPLPFSQSPFQWADYDLSDVQIDFIGGEATLGCFSSMSSK